MVHPERSNDCPYISKKWLLLLQTLLGAALPTSPVFVSVYVQSLSIYFAFHFTLPLLNYFVIRILAFCSAAFALFTLSYYTSTCATVC